VNSAQNIGSVIILVSLVVIVSTLVVHVLDKRKARKMSQTSRQNWKRSRKP